MRSIVLGKKWIYLERYIFHRKNAVCFKRQEQLEEAQAGIKIAWRNINNLGYADDITLMAESEEKLKSP